MPGPAYPAARAVATDVHAHFTRHLARARDDGRQHLATAPDPEAVEAIIDAAFWASLRREEGITPKVSLAFVRPDEVGHALIFAERLPLQAPAIGRLAPAVHRPGVHLGVWRDETGLGVWGIARGLPVFAFVIEVIGSGLLVVKQRTEPFGKFVNVAVLEGDEIKMVDEGGAHLQDCPRVLKSLLDFHPSAVNGVSVNVLVQLAVSIRAHGRGGALLVVPEHSASWQESIVTPVLYAAKPPFTELSELMSGDPAERMQHAWQVRLQRAIDAVAGLTAVDGATLLTDAYELLAFGAKITRRRGSAPVDRVMISAPLAGHTMNVAAPAQLGGTRHLSAAQFVHDQRDATALVASQDGGFTIFEWSPCDEIVHAHRVEALLL